MTSPKLTRERILDAAIAIADAEGVKALSMRKLGRALGVEAMSLYHHVANKDDILDGMLDRVAEKLALPEPGTPWKEALVHCAEVAHEVYLEHRWAAGVLIVRPNVGPARLRYYDALLGHMLQAGFPMPLARQTFLAHDSHVLGFTLQEVDFPFDEAERRQGAEAFLAVLPADLPHMRAMLEDLLQHDTVEMDFRFGLDRLLDGVELLLER